MISIKAEDPARNCKVRTRSGTGTASFSHKITFAVKELRKQRLSLILQPKGEESSQLLMRQEIRKGEEDRLCEATVSRKLGKIDNGIVAVTAWSKDFDF